MKGDVPCWVAKEAFSTFFGVRNLRVAGAIIGRIANESGEDVNGH